MNKQLTINYIVETLRLSEDLWPKNLCAFYFIGWITMPSSSSPWQQSLLWRKLKITTHLCSLWMSRPTNIRSSTLSRSCMTLTSPKSTHSSGRNPHTGWAESQLHTDLFSPLHFPMKEALTSYVQITCCASIWINKTFKWMCWKHDKTNQHIRILQEDSQPMLLWGVGGLMWPFLPINFV